MPSAVPVSRASREPEPDGASRPMFNVSTPAEPTRERASGGWLTMLVIFLATVALTALASKYLLPLLLMRR